jgi:histidinol phosphatase-like PHP family hydrolase
MIQEFLFCGPGRYEVWHSVKPSRPLSQLRKEGCRISMGTDSHGPSQLEFMDLGVAAAIRAKLDPKKILNYMSTDQLLGWAENVRNR